jgi:hypothetical protein
VTDSDQVLTQLQSRIDQSQVQSATVEGQSAPEVIGDCLSFKVGQLDPSMGVKIKEILLRTKSCIVYIDEKFTLQWYWDFPLNAENAAKTFHRAGDLEARIQFLRGKKGQEDNLLSALRLIGEGVMELFTTKGQIAIICTFAGGLGSFISRALDNDNTPISATAGRMLHWIEATLRWCIGLTAGLIVWLLVTGKVAASFLNSTDGQNTFGLVAIARLAGASERLLPSLIQTFVVLVLALGSLFRRVNEAC